MQCEPTNSIGVSINSGALMQEEPVNQEFQAETNQNKVSDLKPPLNQVSHGFNHAAENPQPTQPGIAKEAMIGALLELLKGQGVKVDAITKTLEPLPSSSSVMYSSNLPYQPQLAVCHTDPKVSAHLAQPPQSHIQRIPGLPQSSPPSQIGPSHSNSTPLVPPLIAPFPLPPGNSSRLFIDGIPSDTREREIAHIFRPFPGFRSIRLVPQEHRTGRKFVYCFVDFDLPEQATVVLYTLQGYRFHWRDKKGLRLNYANPSAGKHHKDHRDARDQREGNDGRDYRDNRENRENRDNRDTRDSRDNRDTSYSGRGRAEEDTHKGGTLGKRKFGSDYSASYEQERESFEQPGPPLADAADLSKVTTW